MTEKEWLGDDNILGQDIWRKKYQYNGESFEEWLDRVSNGDTELRNLIVQKKFLFGGRILAGRGTYKDRKITYSNCYVLSTDDSIEDIYETCKNLARTYSYGGGCGIDISKLRPRGAKVNNSANETTGAVSFMPTFDKVTETIGQSGRRGALMISIDVRHPDVEEFINIKTDLNQVNSANISVRVNDDFMNAVKNNEDYYLVWPCEFVLTDEMKDEMEEYGKLYSFKSGNDTIYTRKVKANELFDKLVKNNWDYAEPGILYWSTIEGSNLMSGNPDFKYAGVNPCAEEPLPNGGSCLLGSINLSEFVEALPNISYDESGIKHVNDGTKYFDLIALRNAVHVIYRGLNDVLLEGLPLHPLDKQKESVGKYRQIGMGIMGLADVFIKLGIRYGSKESVELSERIASTILNEAIRSSAEYVETHQKKGLFSGKDKNIALSVDDLEKSRMYMTVVDPNVREYVKKVGGIFNTQLLTIAPTGTISTMLNISGGIEPIFALSYTRLTKSLNGTDTEYEVYPKIVTDYFEEIGEEVNLHNLPEYYVCSATIPNEERILMQGTWQKYIDASISSTINLPESATVDDVRNIYIKSWEMGLKGVTIFRSGCKRAAILTSSADKKKCDCQDFVEKSAPRRPKRLPCKIVRFVNKGERWIAAVGLYEGRPYELFSGLADRLDVPKNADNIYIVRNKIDGHSRYDIEYEVNGEKGTVEGLSTIFNEEYWNYGKLISGLLRHSMPVQYVLKVISTLDFKDDGVNSWKNGVVRALKEFAKPIETDDECPECGQKLVNDGGCVYCPSCGWSKCN